MKYLISILIALPFLFCIKEPDVLSNTLPEGVVELDTASFDTAIIVQDRIAFVDFYLPDCSSCLSMNGIFGHLAMLYSDRVYFGRVDCSANHALAIEHMMDYRLGTVPTFKFL